MKFLGATKLNDSMAGPMGQPSRRLACGAGVLLAMAFLLGRLTARRGGTQTAADMGWGVTSGGVSLGQERTQFVKLCNSKAWGKVDKATLEDATTTYLEHLYHAELDPAGRAAEVGALQKRLPAVWNSTSE